MFLIIFVLFVRGRALDNTPLLCSHGKVLASKITCMKRISELAWTKLESKVCNILSVPFLSSGHAVISCLQFLHQLPLLTIFRQIRSFYNLYFCSQESSVLLSYGRIRCGVFHALVLTFFLMWSYSLTVSSMVDQS